MIRYFLLILLYCQNFSILSQNLVNNDTVNNNITIKFNKVKPSFKEANTAQMNVRYFTKNQIAVIKFDVPSFWFRANTSLADYCIIETEGNKIRLQNQVEAEPKGIDIISIYNFLFVISKDSLLNILSTKIKKISFYFTPNEKRIKKYLSENNYISNEFERHLIKLSRRTLKYKISKPDKVKYKELLLWLNNL